MDALIQQLVETIHTSGASAPCLVLGYKIYSPPRSNWSAHPVYVQCGLHVHCITCIGVCLQCALRGTADTLQFDLDVSLGNHGNDRQPYMHFRKIIQFVLKIACMLIHISLYNAFPRIHIILILLCNLQNYDSFSFKNITSILI